MATTFSAARRGWQPVLFFWLLFLLFFQLVSEFIESIYTFGLLGVEIPPEIGMVVLFFSPLLLLALPRTAPAGWALGLAVAAGGLRAAALLTAPTLTLILRGLGVGCLLAALPLLILHLRRWVGADGAALQMTGGLTAALAASILLRGLGLGNDVSLLRPGLGIGLALLLAAAAWLLEREPAPGEPAAPEKRDPKNAPRVGVPVLALGWMAVLGVLYFAFVSPSVLARWAEADYRLVVLLLATALGVYAWRLASGRAAQAPPARLGGWNWLFLFCGVLAIQISTLPVFPKDPAAYPLYQGPANIWQQVPLYLLVLLSPVTLVDFQALTAELARRESSQRRLAGSFALAAFFFLIVVFAQVFTTVYDYMPVVGPWMRDRFWLAFVLPSAGMILPVLALREPRRGRAVGLHPWALPAILALLVGAVLAAAFSGRFDPIPDQSAGLRVLTYNIQQGYDVDGNRAHEQQMQGIRDLAPDIIGLQETDTARFSGGNSDLVRVIAEGLGMHAYYGPRTVTGTFGIALLSRYPLENPRTFFMYSAGEQTAAIEADVSVDGVRYHILVTHLGNGGPVIQQEQILKQLAGKENVIAMGDFNFRPDTEQYALTTALLQDAYVLAGEPPTEGLNPARRIDHMFVSPGTAVRSAEYLKLPLSDHPALLVEIGP